MVLRKITKKKYRTFRGGAAPPQSGKEGDNSANNAKIAATVTDKNIKDFKNEDFPRGWIIHDLYLAAPVKTEKDYIKQAIVVKRKKAEKKKKEEKFSTVKGIETLKKSTGGLFAAIQKGMTEGRQNFDKFMQGAESIKRGLTMQGKYGRQFSGQMSKARAATQKARATYGAAKADIRKTQLNEIKEKRSKENEAFTKAVGNSLSEIGITDLDSLEKKIDNINNSIIKINENINRVLSSMGGSTFGKTEDFKEKKEKIVNAYEQYDLIKKEMFKDKTNLIEVYMKRNNDTYKDIAPVLQKKRINVIIQQYLEILTKIYQGFLFLVFNYKHYVEKGEKDSPILKVTEEFFSGDKNPWTRFLEEELTAGKEYNFNWLANKLPKLYYESLCFVGNPGFTSTTSRKKFGNRKIPVLFVSGNFISKNDELIDEVIKDKECDHLIKLKGKSLTEKQLKYVNKEGVITSEDNEIINKVIEKINGLNPNK